MKRTVFLLILIIVCIPSFSQDKPIKNSIAFQANIFLDENLYHGHFVQPVWALRYGYNINRNLSVGPEISGTRTFWRSSNVRDAKYTTLNIGGFSRYSLFPDKRISPFVELSLYYNRIHFDAGDLPYYGDNEWTKYKFSGYLAPGISIKSKSRKFSFDLMYKFSPDQFVNSNKSVISYRFNFYF